MGGFSAAAGWLPLTRAVSAFVITSQDNVLGCGPLRNIPYLQLVNGAAETDMMSIGQALWNKRRALVNSIGDLGGLESVFMHMKGDAMRWLPGMDAAIEKVRGEKIVLASVCKNTAGHIPALRGQLESVGERFGDYRVIAYENDSGDGTGGALANWASKNPKVCSVQLTHFKYRNLIIP
jgi:hypothetical protein